MPTDPAARAAARAAELRAAIDDANYRYHVLDDPTIEDKVYDKMLRELTELVEQSRTLASETSERMKQVQGVSDELTRSRPRTSSSQPPTHRPSGLAPHPRPSSPRFATSS